VGREAASASDDLHQPDNAERGCQAVVRHRSGEAGRMHRLVAIAWLTRGWMEGWMTFRSGTGHTPTVSTASATAVSTMHSRPFRSSSAATRGLATGPKITRFTSHSV